MAYRVSIEPTEEPITLAEAKLHLKVDTTADDDLITALIKTGRQFVENRISKKLITQTIEEVYDSFPIDYIKLSAKPIHDTPNLAITYTDTAGDNQTWAASNYVTDFISNPARVAPGLEKDYPSTGSVLNAVKSTYRVGYGDAADVPERFKSAIKLLVGEMYEKRENSIHKMPTTVEFILMNDIDFTQ